MGHAGQGDCPPCRGTGAPSICPLIAILRQIERKGASIKTYTGLSSLGIGCGLTRSIVEDDVEQGAVNTKAAVISDKPQFAEAVHKIAHPGAGCAHHLCQCLLANFWDHSLRCFVLSELGKQQ